MSHPLDVQIISDFDVPVSTANSQILSLKRAVCNYANNFRRILYLGKCSESILGKTDSTSSHCALNELLMEKKISFLGS